MGNEGADGMKFRRGGELELQRRRACFYAWTYVLQKDRRQLLELELGVQRETATLAEEMNLGRDTEDIIADTHGLMYPWLSIL